MKRFSSIVSGAAAAIAVGGVTLLFSQAVDAQKTITVVSSGPLQPYNYVDENGKWVGLQAEALEYATKKAGYTIVYRQMAFENEIPALLNGKVDIASGIYITKERFEKLDYIPLVESYFGILSTKEFAKTVKDWTSYCGKEIAMHFSAVTEDVVTQMSKQYCPADKPAISQQSSGNIPDRITAVRNGRAAGAIDDANMWRAAASRIPDVTVALDKIGKPVYWPIAFKKGSELRKELLPYIAEFLNSPLAEQTALKYNMGRNVYVNGDLDTLIKNYLERK
jgi:ABC-type amino acid transport substrate-binding protein